MAPSSSELKTLDRSTISEIDTTDQLTDVLAILEHVRDAQWKVESTNLGSWDSPGGLVVAGTGNGTLHHELQAALVEAQAAGVRVLRSSRCAEGRVLATTADVLPSAGDLPPAKARVELMLQML